jgi:hypothetical protein
MVVVLFFMVFSKAPKGMVFFFLVFFQNSMAMVFFFMVETSKLWSCSSWFFSNLSKAWMVFFFIVFFQNSMVMVFFLTETSKSWSCSSWFFPKFPKPSSSSWLYFQSHVLLLLDFFQSFYSFFLLHVFFQSSQSCVLFIFGFFPKIPWLWSSYS